MRSSPDPPSLSEWLGWSTQRVSRWVSTQPEPVVMGWPYNERDVLVVLNAS